MKVRLDDGKTVRLHVTSTPYVPDFNAITRNGNLYTYGEFRKVWSAEAQAYAVSYTDTTVQIWEFHDDGTFEVFEIPTNHPVISGTWSYQP